MPNEIFIAICSLAGTLIGSLGGILVSNKLTNWRIEQLEKKVNQHNSVIERTIVLERDQKTLFSHKDNHEKRIQKLEDAV